MIRVGDFNVMNVLSQEKGYLLLELDGAQATLPRREMPRGCRIGGSVKVFVYSNAPNELRATVKKPYGLLDEFACLRVRAVADFGYFLDWGIDKDLFLPKRCAVNALEVGERCIVRISRDPDRDGVIGDTRIKDYLQNGSAQFSSGDEVHILIFEGTPLGYNAIINNEFQGLLYRNEVFEDIACGDSRPAYIKHIREDGGIDLSLQRPGLGGISDAANLLLGALRDRGGSIPLHDKSDPAEIKRLLKMSKKAFKKAAGSLYRQRLVDIREDGIYLR